MREKRIYLLNIPFHPFGYLHIRVNSCTGRSLLSPFLSSLKLILGNSFQVSVIRIEYARYSCEYRIRKASQEYFKALPSLIFLPPSLNSTVQGVWMCIPQSAVFPSLNLTTLRVFVCFIISIEKEASLGYFSICLFSVANNYNFLSSCMTRFQTLVGFTYRLNRKRILLINI